MNCVCVCIHINAHTLSDLLASIQRTVKRNTLYLDTHSKELSTVGEVTLAYFLLARKKSSYLVHFTLRTTVFIRGREAIHNIDI